MIQSGLASPPGTTIELWRDDYRIVAQVVWQDGTRAGLQSQQHLPVEAMMSLSGSTALQLVASGGARMERRKRHRTEEHATQTGRRIEFAGVAAIALTLAVSIGLAAGSALDRPFAKIEAALTR